jgi:hypothetical protein
MKKKRRPEPKWKGEPATAQQINYAKGLAEQLEIDDRFDFICGKWTKGQMSELIDDLKFKLNIYHGRDEYE